MAVTSGRALSMAMAMPRSSAKRKCTKCLASFARLHMVQRQKASLSFSMTRIALIEPASIRRTCAGAHIERTAKIFLPNCGFSFGRTCAHSGNRSLRQIRKCWSNASNEREPISPIGRSVTGTKLARHACAGITETRTSYSEHAPWRLSRRRGDSARGVTAQQGRIRRGPRSHGREILQVTNLSNRKHGI